MAYMALIFIIANGIHIPAGFAGTEEILSIINECDSLVCSDSEMPVTRVERSGSGIQWVVERLESVEPPTYSQQGVVSEVVNSHRASSSDDAEPTTLEMAAEGLQRSAGRTQASLDDLDKSDFRASSTEPMGQQQQGVPPEQQQRQQPAAGGGMQPGQMGAAGQGGMGVGTGLPNMAPNNNRHNLKAGLLYRDDAPSAPRQNSQSRNAQTVTPTSHMVNTSPNQAANTQANSGRDQTREDPRGGAMMGASMMAGQNPNMTGSQFEGQNPRRQQGAPDGHESDGALSKIAKKLGMGGFFGISGGSGASSRQQAASPTQGSKDKKQDPAISKKASELRARKLLQAQFNKLKGHRQLASELEFGSSGSSLFVNMCHHYARYARQHQLPINYAGCPKP